MYSRAIYNRKFGQQVSTDAADVGVPRAFLAKVNIPKPVAADPDGLAAAVETSTSKATVITTFLAPLDVVRNVVVKVNATTAGDVASGSIVVEGIDYAGEALTETHVVTADTPATFTGAAAFKAVTKVTVPKQDGVSVTVDVGWGKVFGLPYILTDVALAILKTFNGAAEANGTLVKDATLAKNTYTPDGTPDGEKDIDVYIIV